LIAGDAISMILNTRSATSKYQTALQHHQPDDATMIGALRR
jgi:hypothetical protein